MKQKPGPKPTHPKTAFLRVRISDRDRDAFLSASCKVGMTLSEWVLSRCRGDAPISPTDKTLDPICPDSHGD